MRKETRVRRSEEERRRRMSRNAINRLEGELV